MQRLVIGSRVHSILYGGRDGVVYAIHGEQQNETIQSIGRGVVVAGGNAYFDVVWENGTESKMLPEALVKSSVQWRILDGVATESEIAQLRNAVIVETEKRKAEQEAKTAAFNKAVAALRGDPKYSYLKQTEPGKSVRAAFAAANLRAQLKKTFPGVKFSVRSDSFSGGDSIDVAWTDGPTYEAVKSIANKYQAGHFDGMEDMYGYSESAWTAVFGDAKYVSCQRSYSFDAMVAAVREVCLETGWELQEVQRDSDGVHGHLPYSGDDRLRRRVSDYLEKRGEYRQPQPGEPEYERLRARLKELEAKQARDDIGRARGDSDYQAASSEAQQIKARLGSGRVN